MKHKWYKKVFLVLFVMPIGPTYFVMMFLLYMLSEGLLAFNRMLKSLPLVGRFTNCWSAIDIFYENLKAPFELSSYEYEGFRSQRKISLLIFKNIPTSL